MVGSLAATGGFSAAARGWRADPDIQPTRARYYVMPHAAEVAGIGREEEGAVGSEEEHWEVGEQGGERRTRSGRGAGLRAEWCRERWGSCRRHHPGPH